MSMILSDLNEEYAKVALSLDSIHERIKKESNPEELSFLESERQRLERVSIVLKDMIHRHTQISITVEENEI